ncbi:hypothetical protein GCM10010915_27540 [Microbacterium faecale]|uniref:SURF1-like protein n=1 Tax=Microbacterium faecale TaxID=1804630 RepID=A0A916YHB4_9MICO|nr:SURF1 family protein [Microbacterium faecale]GGD44785.1 hypothetical protein GCM10010915_27540 [Microbacterium faecale]
MIDQAPAEDPDLEEFPPTLREVMLRPRWIGMLLVCLVVAGIFAWLLQWQLSRALAPEVVPEGATEEVLPISEVVEPGDYLPGPLVGQRIDVTGTWDPDNFLTVSQRMNDGVEGVWVTGRFVTDEGAALATAIGWAPDRAAAQDAIEVLSATADDEPRELSGRLIADEGPVPAPGDDPYEMIRMSPAAHLGQWTDVDGDVYRQFLATTDPTAQLADAGLEEIIATAPTHESTLNWLNVFYAVEWALFAAFSFYLWYRLAKDAWERELEELAGIDPDDLDDER